MEYNFIIELRIFEMKVVCKKCESRHVVFNGKVRGNKRYLCK
jgi:transposase-like protein